MAYPNPTINPPILTSSARLSVHSRSPSRSPIRSARDFDPLLRDLSPSTTLRAFSDAHREHDSPLSQRLDTASAAERALGAKAAQSCLNLRSWTREVESWEWPGTFDVPERARKKAEDSGLGMEAHGDVPAGEYCGSLPEDVVYEYEHRLDEISRGLETLDIETLKGFVLSAHRKAGDGWATIDDSIGAIGAHTDLRQLDDFTALITATILQALPYLSRLNRLLDVWHIRLRILRQTPAFLRALDQAQKDLNDGWAAIAVSSGSGIGTDTIFTADAMHDRKANMERQMTRLGRKLDGFLDDLEGRQETVPDSWIDKFEKLESAYGEWVVQAVRRVLDYEWRVSQERRQVAEKMRFEEAQEASGMPGPTRNVSESFFVEDHARDGDAVISPSVSRGLNSDAGQAPEAVNEHQAITDIPIGVASTGALQGFTSRGDNEVGRSPTRSASPTKSVTDSPTKHARHVPIMVAYTTPDMIQQPFAPYLDQAEVPLSSLPQNAAPVGQAGANVAKKRAAFAGAEIERAASLQRQAKSPVRPFEHASNAFTRLFRRDKTPEVTRSDSQRSSLSGRSSTSKTSRSNNKGGRGEEVGDAAAATSPPLDTNLRRSFGRSRSTSQRSDRSLAGAMVDSMPISRPSNRTSSQHRDYIDMPGGFRPRSLSADGSSPGMQSPMSQPPNCEGRELCLPRLHSAPKVETYQPKRLESPYRPPAAKSYREPEYPADWPLASPIATETNSPVKGTPPLLDTADGAASKSQPHRAVAVDDDESSPEIAGPRVAMRTDVFEGLFVSSLPATPEVPPEFDRTPLARPQTSSWAQKHHIGPVLDEEIFDQERAADADVSDNEGPGGQTPDCFNMESESPSSSATSLVEGETQGEIPRTHSRFSRGPPTPLRIQIPGTDAVDDTEMIAEDGAAEKPVLLHRASVASIEMLPRGAVRSIDLTRRSSHPSGNSVPQTPVELGSIAETGVRAPREVGPPLACKGLLSFPLPPVSRREDGPVSSIASQLNTLGHSRRGSLLPQHMQDANTAPSPVSPGSDASPAPLNAAMGKRQDKKRIVRDQVGSPSTAAVKPGEDAFDRHVSDVLDRLPTHAIRFKARPGTATPTARTAEPRNYSGPRPTPAKRLTSRPSIGGMTLAPAEASPKKQAADEVKLYHLSQAGRDEPIKLFVRLVGEGERVMVRVGGGWADLAEYLRQYAEHHGSRTVSGGSIELQTAESAGPSSRKVSSSAIPQPPTKTKDASQTLLSGKDDAPDWLKEEQPRFTMGDSSGTEGDGNPTALPQPRHTPTVVQSGTPKSAKSTSTKDGSSRPSTAGSLGRPGSRQGWSEAGLAGPSPAKRSDLSSQKAKWVEGMMEKARAQSAEKSKEEKGKFFGELGKAGGTRRVIFRSGSRNEAENRQP